MKYREEQKKNVESIRDRVFKDAGNGVFRGKPREFVLSEPSLNLWEGIREDVISYFNQNKIAWWFGEKNGPTGHLLSSQVACVNHLYFIKQRPDIALQILRELDPSIISAEKIDAGYVEFEFIGSKQYLPERVFTRGANCTSVDAAMIGSTKDGKRILFLIEWKYTETYQKESLYIPERAKVYDKYIRADDSPFDMSDVEVYYYEPFYQMMRQTLLGFLCVKNADYDCVDYRLVHVIPEKNSELLNTITSPGLSGVNICDAWKKVLKYPEKYISITPEKLLESASEYEDTKSILGYLRERYWG